jgi:hypothetical protein
LRVPRFPKSRAAMEHLESMHVKRWVVFAAVFVGTVLPVYANSTSSASPKFLAGTNNQTSDPGQAAKGALLFRDTIRDGWRNRTGIPSAHWDTSSSSEIPGDQERLVTLPEPGSGILLLIGVSALISRRSGFADKNRYRYSQSR